MLINEEKCTFTHEGKSYTARGAYLDDNGGAVYITKSGGNWIAQTWDGQLIAANVCITSEWTRYGTRYGEPYTMRQIRFSIADKVYTGRYGSDWSQLCFVRRVKKGWRK